MTTELKIKLLDKWRPTIFSRDNHKCRFCSSTNILQLAHIKPCSSFIEEGIKRGKTTEDCIRESFTKNNLVTLCNKCHYIHHIYVDGDRGRLSKKNLKRARKINNMLERLAQIEIKPRYELTRGSKNYWEKIAQRKRKTEELKKHAIEKIVTPQRKKPEIKIIEERDFDTRELLFGRKKCKEGLFMNKK